MKAKVLIAITLTSLAGVITHAKVNDTVDVDESTARNLAKKGRIEILDAKGHDQSWLERRSVLPRKDAKVRKLAYHDARKKRLAAEVEEAKRQKELGTEDDE